jgi:hypothetical protein
MTGQPGLQPVQANLRSVPDGRPGKWLHGALHMSPGNLQWVPAHAGDHPAVDLAAAMVLPAGSPGSGSTLLQTSDGVFELELPADMFMMTQELVAQAPGTQPDQDWLV